MRLLCVEDDLGNAGFLARVLEAAGYEVVCAANGKAALGAMARARPDLILLDIGLPDMDGFEVMARARAQRLAECVPVLVVTGWVGPAYRARAHREGFVGFLEKPLRVEDLRRAVAFARGTDVFRGSSLGGAGG